MNDKKIEKEFTFTYLGLYIGIAYAFSWLFWLPQVLSVNQVVNLPDIFVWIVGFIAPWGPFVSSFMVMFIVRGKEGVKAFFKRGADINFNKKWFLPTFLIFPIWAGIAFLIGVFTTTLAINLPWFSNPLWLLFNFEYSNILYLFFFTGIAEEFGWRGFALDILQRKFNASVSTIFLGVIWAFWHLPIFFVGAPEFQFASFGIFIVQVTFYSFLYTWIYNNARKSLLTAIILHTMEDFTLFALFPVVEVFGADSIASISMYILAMVLLALILILWSPKTLATRKGANLPPREKKTQPITSF